MNVFRKVAEEAVVGVAVATTPEALSLIQQPGCAAAIWRRRPLTGFQDWIDSLPPDQLPRAQIVLRPARAHRALTEIFAASTPSERGAWATLADDISSLADVFAAVMHTPFLRLRLDVITTNACRKFHIDAVAARLICTYRGTGTQYGISTDGAAPRQVFTVPTGAPMLMRGTLWPETPKSGLLHRSPPIEGSGETRLVLVLDAVSDPDGEAVESH